MKPEITTIHQIAASGGTVICQCLAAMERVRLLSEVHPLATIIQESVFSPSTLVDLYLARYPVSDRAQLREEHIQYQINSLVNSCKRDGKTLCLRDWSYFDFFRTDLKRPVLRNSLSKYNVKSVVTVRHPIDCYLSGLKSGFWERIENNFSNYCERYSLFLDAYAGLPIHRYEDFTHDPQSIMQRICKDLEIPYDSEFITKFHTIKLTGNSGRKGNKIEPRSRQPISQDLADTIRSTKLYTELCRRLGYDTEL